MRSFHDIRFSAAVASDIECEVSFATDIIRTAGGQEYRNGLLAQPRHGYRWSVSRHTTEMENLRQFYGARKGSKYSFRFQDPLDHVLVKTVISTGSTGTNFNIVKKYTLGSSTYERRILLPDTSQTTVYVNGTAIASSAWSLSTSYQLQLNSAPGAGNAVEVEGVFDVPVRFDAGLVNKIAAPEVDEVDVELVEARYSATPTYSTGATWSPGACNISTKLNFRDDFSGSALSTNWTLFHHHSTIYGPGAIRQWQAGSSNQNTTVSGGFFRSSTLAPPPGDTSIHLGLQLNKALRPPFKVRLQLSLRPATVAVTSNYFMVLIDTLHTTGNESTNKKPATQLAWFSTAFGYMQVESAFPQSKIPYDSTDFHDALYELEYGATYITCNLWPTTGSTVTQTKNTTWTWSTADLYMKLVSFSRLEYTLDWIEVKSL